MDSKLFYPGVVTSHPQVIYFGGLKKYKRPLHAILAFKKLLESAPNARLIMVGEGPQLEQLKDFVRESGTEESVSFIGHISQASLAKVIRESWVNLHCSTGEGWAYSVMEASASGTPTVGYRSAGLTDSIINGETGITVPNGEINELASGLARMIEERDPWSKRAREWAQAFDWDISAKSWERVLRDASQPQPKSEMRR